MAANGTNGTGVVSVPANESTEAFIADNALDEESASTLRHQPADVQAAVVDAGPLREARNPAAVLRARIRSAVGDGDTPWNQAGGGQRSGKVKLWHAAKGYGFVICDDTQEELFCHHSDIGGRSLVKEGQVTFDVGQMDNGKLKCVNVSGDVGPRIDTRGKGDDEGTKGEKGPKGKGKIQGKGGSYEPYAGKGGGKLKSGKGASFKGPAETRAEVHVEVPTGHRPGQDVRFTLAGQQFEVSVPAGVYPGEMFIVSM